jgi:pyruvate dehydrogenase E1 component alpha subunit/2-oxoisovalerate dehydrogenase E1 component alpha subunit
LALAGRDCAVATRSRTGLRWRVPAATADAPPSLAEGVDAEDFRAALRWMLLARAVDEKLAALYRAGKIVGGVYLGRGQEALSAAIGTSLRPGDVFAPLIRDTAGRLAFGEPLLDGIRTYLGSPLGPMRARDGNVHRGRPREGLLPMISHLGAMVSVVNGALFARRLRGQAGSVGAAVLGDGATSTGAFHEALNQAAVENLPLVLVIADNQFAYSTPRSRQFACRSLADKAPGYGVAAHEVDGTDLLACLATLRRAVALARQGEGPQLVVASLLRLCGHGEHDDAGYVPARLRESGLGRDCMAVAEQFAVKRGLLDAPVLASWRQQIARQVDEAVAVVQREAVPDPYRHDWSALASPALRAHATEAPLP